MAIELKSKSPEATAKLGEIIGEHLRGGVLVLLMGELGAGKTVFAKGLGRGLGVSGEITSPSFNLMLRYYGRICFDHWDLYRLDCLGDDEEFLESVYDNESVTAVEWGERVQPKPDVPTLAVEFGFGEDHRTRIIRLEGSAEIIAELSGLISKLGTGLIHLEIITR
jgi:tRNA threonylcarbamoyladenosine biosynthesis protein TsaE